MEGELAQLQNVDSSDGERNIILLKVIPFPFRPNVIIQSKNMVPPFKTCPWQSVRLSHHKETSVSFQPLPEETEQLIKPINSQRSTVL